MHRKFALTLSEAKQTQCPWVLNLWAKKDHIQHMGRRSLVSPAEATHIIIYIRPIET